MSDERSNHVDSLQNFVIRNKPTTFLTLPLEIRQHIYSHAIPHCRLAPFPYSDPEWQMKPPSQNEHRGIPPILHVSRQVHSETTPLIYSRAILEIAPPQQRNYFIDLQDTATQKVTPYAFTRLSNTFHFYNPNLLKLIQRAHIFSNQSDVIDGSCYESLLSWLVTYTGISTIQLSSRPMTRIRGKATFNLESWRRNFHDNSRLRGGLRVIRIWTRGKRPPWEYEKMMRLRCKVADGTLHPLQIYFWRRGLMDGDGGGVVVGDLQLDPRWLTRVNDEAEKIGVLEEAAPMIDAVMRGVLSGKELCDYESYSRHFVGEEWVYQVMLVAEHG